MKIGILSDSHGRVGVLRQGLQRLEMAGAECYIHCGDVGGVEAIEELAGRRCWFVWGNTDCVDSGERAYVQELGLTWPDGPLCMELEGHRVAVFHGHERGFASAIEGGEFDYVFHGHTHQKADHRVGKTRVINPGALHRVSVKTVALLDLATDELQYIEVDAAI